MHFVISGNGDSVGKRLVFSAAFVYNKVDISG